MSYTTKEGMNYADKKPLKTYNFVEIPDNATNGDVIKALFPNSEPLFVLGNVPKEDIIKIDNEVFTVERSWWNAPYKREGE